MNGTRMPGSNRIQPFQTWCKEPSSNQLGLSLHSRVAWTAWGGALRGQSGLGQQGQIPAAPLFIPASPTSPECLPETGRQGGHCGNAHSLGDKQNEHGPIHLTAKTTIIKKTTTTKTTRWSNPAVRKRLRVPCSFLFDRNQINISHKNNNAQSSSINRSIDQ